MRKLNIKKELPCIGNCIELTTNLSSYNCLANKFSCTIVRRLKQYLQRKILDSDTKIGCQTIFSRFKFFSQNYITLIWFWIFNSCTRTIESFLVFTDVSSLLTFKLDLSGEDCSVWIWRSNIVTIIRSLWKYDNESKIQWLFTLPFGFRNNEL